MKNISKLGGSSESAEEPLTGTVQTHTNSTVIPLWVPLPQVQFTVVNNYHSKCEDTGKDELRSV